MNAQQNAPISDRFSSLCARVFSPAAAILESEKTLGTRLALSWRYRYVSFQTFPRLHPFLNQFNCEPQDTHF